MTLKSICIKLWAVLLTALKENIVENYGELSLLFETQILPYFGEYEFAQGRAIKLTNVSTMDGVTFDKNSLIEWLNVRLSKALIGVLRTDQGVLVVCHGTPDGHVVYHDESGMVRQHHVWHLMEEVTKQYGQQHYILLSCHAKYKPIPWTGWEYIFSDTNTPQWNAVVGDNKNPDILIGALTDEDAKNIGF